MSKFKSGRQGIIIPTTRFYKSILISFYTVFILSSIVFTISCKDEGTKSNEALDCYVRKFVVQVSYKGGNFYENIYLFFEKQNDHGVIIDPGARSRGLENFIENTGITIIGILNTHGHFDHIGANGYYRKKYKVNVYGHSGDKAFYQSLNNQPSYWLEDESVLKLGNLQVQVFNTPGHSPGSVCFLIHGHLFTGDTLFKGMIGRTHDKPANESLLHNVKTKVFNLPGDTPVYPGHGALTTVGSEKTNNPFFR